MFEIAYFVFIIFFFVYLSHLNELCSSCTNRFSQLTSSFLIIKYCFFYYDYVGGFEISILVGVRAGQTFVLKGAENYTCMHACSNLKKM